MKIFNIKWDTTGDYEQCEAESLGLTLPTEVNLEFDMEEDEVSDFLSDEYGFCVESFEIE